MSIEPADFAFLADFIRSESAIVLEQGKEYLVEARLTPVARAEGHDSLATLIATLRKSGNARLRKRVVEALTTNETSFFRDVEPFEALRQEIIPELMAKRSATREISFWSAAASTGQEPYSVLMLLREHFPQLAKWKVRYLATDISSEVLARARIGRYSQLEINRGLPPSYLEKYFTKVGNDWEVRPELRAAVQFEELNLVRPWPALGPFDVILMRNVLIYFDHPTKQGILAKVRQVLRPDGVLFLGGSESTINIDDNFVRRGVGRASCYVLGHSREQRTK